jgi:Rne/Rng family ribonuclease
MVAVDRLVISAIPGEILIVAMSEKNVVEFIIDRGEPQIGDIFIGKIISLNKTAGFAFVEIKQSVVAYMPIRGKMNEGLYVIVQVTHPKRLDKKISVTSDILLEGSFIYYTPHKHYRTLPPTKIQISPTEFQRIVLQDNESISAKALGNSQDYLNDFIKLQALWNSWQKKINSLDRKQTIECLWQETSLQKCSRLYANLKTIEANDHYTLSRVKPYSPQAILNVNCYEAYAIQDQLETALFESIQLPSGGRITLSETAALVAIDVDSGHNHSKLANLEAIDEICKQIHLRGLSGHILVDMIPMKKLKDKKDIQKKIREKLSLIPNAPRLVGITPLGLYEIIRERLVPSLSEYFLQQSNFEFNEASLCYRGLRQFLKEFHETPQKKLCLALPLQAFHYFNNHPSLQKEITQILGKPLEVVENKDFQSFEIIEKKDASNQ